MPKPEDVIAAPMTRPPTKSQKPLVANPEKITSCGAAPIARNARKITNVIVASGRLRVANAEMPEIEMARTCKDALDVVRIHTREMRAIVAAKPCAMLILGRSPLKARSRFAVGVSIDLKDCGGVIIHRHKRIAFFI